jgi:hypothetical protein
MSPPSSQKRKTDNGESLLAVEPGSFISIGGRNHGTSLVPELLAELVMDYGGASAPRWKE